MGPLAPSTAGGGFFSHHLLAGQMRGRWASIWTSAPAFRSDGAMGCGLYSRQLLPISIGGSQPGDPPRARPCAERQDFTMIGSQELCMNDNARGMPRAYLPVGNAATRLIDIFDSFARF